VRSEDGEPPIWELDLGMASRARFADFIKVNRLDARTRLTMAASGRQRCVFENVLRRHRGDAELISQYHPLIGFIRSRLDQDEAFRSTTASAVRLAQIDIDQLAAGTYVFAVSRWTTRGEQDAGRLAFEVLRLGDSVQMDSLTTSRGYRPSRRWHLPLATR